MNTNALPLTPSESNTAFDATSPNPSLVPWSESESADPAPPRRVEVVQEELSIGRRVTDTGRGIRLHKTVHEDWVEYDATRVVETAEVERVPIGRVVDGPVPTRYEGAVLVVPVVEERLVLRKELVLVEEVRITHRQRTVPGTERVPLRRESVTVERFGPSEEPAPGDASASAAPHPISRASIGGR